MVNLLREDFREVEIKRRIKLIIEVTVKALRAIVNAFSCTARF
jgi:hypothetical protein